MQRPRFLLLPHPRASRAFDLLSFARRHDRDRLEQFRLIQAAELWRQRDLQIALHRRALRTNDRTSAACYRITALDRSTARIRRALVTAHRNTAIAEDSAFRLL